MGKKFYGVGIAVLIIVLLCGMNFTNASAEKAKPAEKAAKVDICYGCHAEIKDFHAKGKHAKVNCASCHDDLDKHLKDAAAKPATKMDHAKSTGSSP